MPATLKAEVMPRINEVSDRLKAARRSIDQDKELVKALTKIKDATAASDAVTAYKVRIELLRAFPAVEADASLAEATRAIGLMERKQVKVQQSTLKASAEDVPSVDAIESQDLPLHRALTAGGIRIVESLDLSAVAPGVYTLVALPLRLVGADASPVRAVLIGQCIGPPSPNPGGD